MTHKQAIRIRVLVEQLEQNAVRATDAITRLKQSHAELREAIEQATNKGDRQL